MKKYCCLLLFSLFSVIAFAQMPVNGQILYGNEWIDYDKSYLKVLVDKDGFYRITQASLVNNGWEASALIGADFKVFASGNEIAINVSTDGLFTASDYIEFYGVKNRGELDRFLFDYADLDQLNPEYSYFTDESAYYLGIYPNTTNLRYTELANDIVNNVPSKEEYYNHEEQVVFSDFHYKPVYNGGDQIRYSNFHTAEGYGSTLASTNNVSLASENIVDLGQGATVRVRIGSNAVTHNFDISLNGSTIASDAYNGSFTKQYEIEVPVSTLNNNNTISVKGLNGSTDRNMVATASIIYPRSFDFSGASNYSFTLTGGPFDRYLEIENFDSSGDIYLYNLTSGYKISPISENGVLKVRIPASAADQEFVLVNTEANHTQIGQFINKEFIDYSTVNPEYIILSSEKINNATTGSNPVESYANHRASQLGGGYDTYIVNVEDLYDQFAYGVDRHSLSVRNFAHYCKTIWSRAEYFFVIGKSREYSAVRTEEDRNNPENVDFMVPTLGAPGSDNLMFAEQGPGKFLPLYKIGRLPVNNKQEVQDYLDKIIAYESYDLGEQTIEDKLWRKQVIHLAGGSGQGEQGFIQSRLDAMANTLENNSFGAEVTTFVKNTSDPIQTNVSQVIIDQINEGAGIITFFGHSSTGTFDFSLENPSKYDNNFLNPVMISLGCHSGNIHAESVGISESFVIIPERGAIAFIASSSTAYISPQAILGGQFYDLLGQELYGRSIGEILNNIILSNLGDTLISRETLMQQLTLNGDPAIIIQDYEGPDYVVDSQSLGVNPDIVSTNTETFGLLFDVLNLGSNIDTTIQVSIKHRNSEDELLLDTLITGQAPDFSTEFVVTLPTPGTEGLGKNSVEIVVDPSNQLEELPSPDAELNNKLVASTEEEDYCFFVLDAGIKPIWPTEFDIVNDDCEYILKAATDNIFVEQQNYIFEIDTTELFDSPLKETAVVNSMGGLVEWTPSTQPENNTVYYWRVRPEEDNDGKILWSNSSFVYIANGDNGWNQSHFYQYQKNELSGLDYRNNLLQFDTSGLSLTFRNALWDGLDGPNAGLFFNFEKQADNVAPWLFMPNGGVAFAVWDSRFFKGLENSGGDFGSIVTSLLAGFKCYGFETDTPEKRKLVMDMMEEHIQQDEFVLFFTVLPNNGTDLETETWLSDESVYGKTIMSILEDQGASLIRDLDILGTVPYAIMYQKDLEIKDEAIGADINDKISITGILPRLAKQGELQTDFIGPAKKWENVIWNYSDFDNLDTFYIDVYAIDEVGQEIIIHDNTRETNLDLSMANELSAKYLKLSFFAKDEINVDPPQIDYLRVFYEGIPDGTINAENEAYVFNADTLRQGENLEVTLPIYNYTAQPIDPAEMVISIIDANNTETVDTLSITKIDAKSTVLVSYSLSTIELGGEYQFRAEYNPARSPEEEHYFNNFGLRSFYVESDKINPVLDVRFDGLNIIDGDLVSSKPEITISAKDENDYLLIDDPALFELALKYPNGNTENIPVGDNRLTFIPADSANPENKASLIFSPDLTEDGVYKLFAQAKDKSDNFSGNNAYEVSFEVITKKAISNVLNYPNPFSTKTQFVYTVTGSEAPSSMMINIYTVSGKLVKQIMPEEIGPAKVGVNRTNYSWDGTDEYGNRLANGVYLYKVFYGDDIQDFETLFNNTDSYFDNGFGKMVIMR